MCFMRKTMAKPKILGLLVFLVGACGDHKADRSDTTKAPHFVSESFIVEPSTTLGKAEDPRALNVNHHVDKIGIKKQSLDKEFLLQGAILPQTQVPQFTGLKSRIVAFKSVGDKLYMMEATQGHQISPTLPQKLVLAEFPILSETENEIYFDFAKGMNKIYTKDDWTGQDFAGSDYSMDHWTSLDLGISYIEDATIDDKNNLVITQVGQTRQPFLGLSNLAAPMSIKYYLSPYEPNPSFKHFVQENFDRMGFFEVSPQLKKERGDTVIYASKFNLPEPGKFITFAISSNTPEEYKKAVEDGVLYWNQAFGREVLKVEYLNEPLTAPNFYHNIIQWVEWDNAGSAYADAQMDPRTGEVLHAQVFMTSAFAFGGRAKARKLLQRIKSESHDHQHNHAEPRHPLLGFLGMGKTPLCFYHPGEHLVTSLENLLARNDLDEAGFLKISQDYVREVVAHEVGHTLGLRHNFAGSLASNLSSSTSQQAYENYLKNGQAPAYVTTTSSVMDYQVFEDSTMSGDIIARKERAFDYDLKVIRTLYDGKVYANSEVPLFCTDSHTEEFVDCNRFDSGASVFDFYFQQERKVRQRLPYTIMESYIAGKAFTKKRNVNELELSLGAFSPSPHDYATQVFSYRSQLFNFIKEGKKVLKVRRSHDYINDLNEDDVAEEESAFFDSEVKVHSLAEIFEEISPSEILDGKKKFDTLLQDESYLSGIGPDGEVYRFDHDDLDLMKNDTQKFFSRLEPAYTAANLSSLASLNEWRELSVASEAATLIAHRAQKFVETFSMKQGQTVPTFTYPLAFRLKAASLYTLKSSDSIWLKKQAIEAFVRFNSLMTFVMGAPVDKVDVRSLDEEKMRWFSENLEVYSVLQKAL